VGLLAQRVLGCNEDILKQTLSTYRLAALTDRAGAYRHTLFETRMQTTYTLLPRDGAK